MWTATDCQICKERSIESDISLFFFQFPGTLEGSIFKVVLENVAVQRGDHFEVYPKYISPNLTNTSHRIECGYNSSVGNLIAITDWNDSLSPPSMIVPPRGTEYSDRATVRNSFIMRIKNATSQDEGRSFYCRLSNFNLHPSYYTDHVKLETVYGEIFS